MHACVHVAWHVVTTSIKHKNTNICTLFNRDDAIRGTKLIVSHFKRFGLTVHTGSRSLGEGSKTEALYIPPPRKESHTKEELLVATGDIVIDDDRHISYTDEFKYLGSLLEKQLNDIVDINARIKQAKGQFQAMRDNVFTNQGYTTTRATTILQCPHR